MLDVRKAIDELKRKTLAEIQHETALAWAARAMAAYTLALESGNVRWALDGEEYYHEALEHSAFAGSGVTRTVQHNVEPLRMQVMGKLR